jgi:hypothetical protein
MTIYPSSNEALKLTAGRCDDRIYFHETASTFSKARFHQRWLILFSLAPQSRQ